MNTIVYMDCIVVKVRQDGSVTNKAVFLALGVNTEGQKELLGMWLAENEGANFWLSVLTELKNRGLQDILIACVDGLKGFPEVIYLAIMDASKKWSMPIRNWRLAMTRFIIEFGDRLSDHL